MTDAEISFRKLIGKLGSVSNLDALQVLCSNEVADRQSPELRDWLGWMIGAERSRRLTGIEPEFICIDVREAWPPTVLVDALLFSEMMTESASLMGEPTIMDFAWRLHNLLVAHVGAMFLEQHGVAHHG